MTKSSPSTPTQTTVTCGPPVELSVVRWAKGPFTITSSIESGIFICILPPKLCGNVSCWCPHCHLQTLLVSQHSSIHWDRRTGHIRGVRGGDKDDYVSDLLRLSETFDRHGRDKCSLIFICTAEACEHTRVRSARCHYVYANTGPCHFQSGGLGYSFHRMFTPHVNRCC